MNQYSDEDGPLLSISAEEVAERYCRDRPGFRLVDFDYVGLPLYRLDLDAMFLDTKRISPIEEFILRAIEAGLSQQQEIESFLGLDQRIVKRSMVSLARSEDIALQAFGEDKRQVLSLTNRGRATKAECERIVPTDHEVFIYFDGVLRRPVARGSETPLSPKDLREMGIREIPPFPSLPPILGDLQPREVFDVLRTSWSGVKRSKELLAIKSIVRRQRFFRRAVALIYRSLQGNEVQVAFAIDGRLSDEHEKKFAMKEGPEKTGIIHAVLSKPDLTQAIFVVGSVNAELAEPLERSDELKVKVQLAEKLVRETGDTVINSAKGPERDAAIIRQHEMEMKLEAAKASLSSVKSRMIGVLEHAPLLLDAVNNSQKRLVIISPWIRAAVVNQAFCRRLEDRLRRKVEVYIGYGLGESEEEYRNQADRWAEQSLQALSVKYPTFVLRRFGDTHAKVLISDSRFCIATSFNWLSFRGDAKRTFREELGVLISDPQQIQESFEMIYKRFDYQK